jgi:predicted aminopeptidase
MGMKIIKRILLLLFIGIVVFLAYYHELVIYGISQGKGQLEIIQNARPIAEALRDPDFPDSLKTNLRFVTDIKDFAFDSLGINFSKNYSTVYDQKGKELMFVVTACEPYMLEPKEWKFPFIGTFSYKGFFDLNKAKKLAQELKDEDLDVNIRTAGGWSTLGWFEDPILSNMLAETEAEFAETIIHELTHGTLFVKDSLRFNENLATFIGIKGTELYLSYKYGEQSEELLSYQKLWEDRNKVSKHILNGSIYLDSLYKSMTDSMELKIKEKMKENAISLIISSLDTLSLANKERYKNYYLKHRPNNTLFMSYLRYRGDYELLTEELLTKYKNNFRIMLEDYKNKYPSL